MAPDTTNARSTPGQFGRRIIPASYNPRWWPDPQGETPRRLWTRSVRGVVLPNDRMPTTPTRRFRIALSYPGEHRPFVEQVAELLAAAVSIRDGRSWSPLSPLRGWVVVGPLNLGLTPQAL